MLYMKACNVDRSVIDLATYEIMAKLFAQRTEARRNLIGDHAALEIEALIAAAGQKRFCEVYGRETTPKMRALNEAARKFLGR